MNVSQTVIVSLASKLINSPLLSLLPPLIRTVLKKYTQLWKESICDGAEGINRSSRFWTTTSVRIFCSDHPLPLCCCPLPNMLKVAQSIGVIGKLKPATDCTSYIYTDCFMELQRGRTETIKNIFGHTVPIVMYFIMNPLSNLHAQFSQFSLSHRSYWIFHPDDAPCHKSRASKQIQCCLFFPVKTTTTTTKKNICSFY